MKRNLSFFAGFVAILLFASHAAAMYHPALGRFIQRDPVGYDSGMNLCRYVSGNPTSNLDPFGLREIKLTITRARKGKHATLGEFKMEAKDFTTVSGYTLELIAGTYDVGKGAGKKTYPIPAGTYKAKPSSFRGRWAVKLQDVPGFTGILVHVGNYVWDTSACVLVGATQQVNVNVNRPKRITVKTWRKYVELKMITETKKDTSGKSDVVWQSSATLRKMKALYDKVKKKDGEKCTFITVVVEEPAPESPPSTQPSPE